MRAVTRIPCYPPSPTPTVALDRWLLSSRPTADPPGRIEVLVELTVREGRYYAKITKSVTDAKGGWRRPAPGDHSLLFEIPREAVIMRTDLRAILHAATADPDFAPSKA
jgi:hypothetical protein